MVCRTVCNLHKKFAEILSTQLSSQCERGLIQTLYNLFLINKRSFLNPGSCQSTPFRKPLRPVTDNEALDAFQLCTPLEGIIPALESAHGLAQLMKIAALIVGACASPL